MATNTNLGGVFTTDIENKISSNVFISTENVVGLIFDTSVVGGLTAALGTGEAATIFANGNVVEFNDAKDVKKAGIDETVLAGVAKYHLDNFFALAGPNQRIFVSFMDSKTDTKFEAIESMQLAANGIIYQIGVWTGEAIATEQDVKEGDKTVKKFIASGTNALCVKLQNVAEVLGGKVGVTNYEGNAPLNILVSAPVVNKAVVDVTKLPDLSTLDLPKVSVLVGQESSEAVHKMMYAVNKVTADESYAPVGCIGVALACLAIAPANENIAHVASFNLASLIQNAELGFGKIVKKTEANADNYDDASSFTNIKTMGYVKRNTCLHKNGYIFLTNYDGLENGIFLSSDQTLSTGDYRSLTRCRVMHKSRRVVRRALLPKVNDTIEVDISTGNMADSEVSALQNLVLSALDLNMVEPGTQKPQISGRSCEIDAAQDILNTDEIKIEYMLVPLGTTAVFNVTEGFVSSTSSNY